MIENTFGILANQWRIYRKPIVASPDIAARIVQSTVCFHNWLRKDDIGINNYLPLDTVDRNNPDNPDSFNAGSWRRIMEDGCAFTEITNCDSNMSARTCVNIRNEFCRYFNNEGAVPWQYDQN